MSRCIRVGGLAILAATLLTGPILAQEPAPASVEQRLAGLEAYVNNVDPAGSKVVGVPGPGHNAWVMVSAALVLFMTLPGLALFYGGLVRQKNVLSVLTMPRHRGRGDHPLVLVRLQSRIRDGFNSPWLGGRKSSSRGCT